MRDAQIRRYARHILLPDVGGHGQRALLAARAVVALPRDADDRVAALIAARYLAAGGVGAVVMRGATEGERADVAAHAADGEISTRGDGGALAVPARPSWWPGDRADVADADPASASAPTVHDGTTRRGDGGDGRADVALAFWRGGMAALRWMAEIANPPTGAGGDEGPA